MARALAPHMIEAGWGPHHQYWRVGGTENQAIMSPRCATPRSAPSRRIWPTTNWAPDGINVVAIHPGATRTEKTDPATEEKFAKAVSIGRIVDASEIAFLVAFLASPKSIAINGETLCRRWRRLRPHSTTSNRHVLSEIAAVPDCGFVALLRTRAPDRETIQIPPAETLSKLLAAARDRGCRRCDQHAFHHTRIVTIVAATA